MVLPDWRARRQWHCGGSERRSTSRRAGGSGTRIVSASWSRGRLGARRTGGRRRCHRRSGKGGVEREGQQRGRTAVAGWTGVPRSGRCQVCRLPSRRRPRMGWRADPWKGRTPGGKRVLRAASLLAREMTRLSSRCWNFQVKLVSSLPGRQQSLLWSLWSEGEREDQGASG